MSDYPQSFRANCVGTIPLGKNNNTCSGNKPFCDLSKHPIIIENDKIVSEEQAFEKMPGMVRQSTNSHCQAYGHPQNVIQSNEIHEKPQWSHSWSNQRGYGNIVLATNDTCNNVHGRVHPYNRLTALKQPYEGPAVIRDAWKINNAKHLMKLPNNKSCPNKFCGPGCKCGPNCKC